jgi:IgGFc binding protein
MRFFLMRFFSIRSVLVPCLCAVWLAGFAAAPSGTHAQHITTLQTRTPINDTQCQCGGGGATVPPATNAGTEFMLCFEENIDGLYESNYSSGSDLQIYIASVGNLDTVTVTTKAYPALDTVFILQPNSSVTYDITNALIQGIPMHNLWIVSDEVADNTVVQVQSTSSIVCYGLNYKYTSADAFCALPLQSAGTDYRIMSYPNSQSASPNTSSQFAVAAFEDNTTVTITPSVPTLGGNPAGSPFTMMLQQGQCIQVQTQDSVNGLDLTGSIVSADHPITVYGSHERTEAPPDWSTVAHGISRDILLQAMPPTSTWGQAFVLDPIALESTGTTGPDGDILRVLALNDSTVVTVNGNTWVMLNHNQFADSIVTGPTLVQSSGPILVAEIEHSDYFIGGDSPGDPSLLIVPPVDQTFNNYTFFLANNTNFTFQGLIIAANTSAQANIMLDGALIPSAEFKPISGTVNGNSFALYQQVSLTQGVHTISTTNQADQGFTILAYGLGDEVSYGYAAGSLLSPKRTIGIDYPPVTLGPVHPNFLNFHNTSYQPAYVDSAVFIPDYFKDQGYNIHPEEDVPMDIGRMNIGGSAQIHFVSDDPIFSPVSGTVKIYSHLPSYLNIEPASMRFTLYPDQASDVSQQDALALTVTATPNPFSEFTTINFSVPATGDITMILYDELGRVVQHVAYGDYSPGSYSVHIDRHGLANGVYVCEITSSQLNIHQRIPIVAGE